MELVDGGTDAVVVVRRFVEGLAGRTPSRAEVLTIRRELEDLEARVAKIRAMGPEFRSVDLGDEVKSLCRILRRGGGLRSAASFL